MKSTSFLVMDVDGTLTDGKIYMGPHGELAKAFDVKDGAGILLQLPKLNIIPIIITARESQILENRCRELQISELHQGVNNKLEKLNEILERHNKGLNSVAYIGDDLPDIPCMEAVKLAGGVVLCPINAIPEIKQLANYISGFKAGEGAVRDCISFLTIKKRSAESIIIKQSVDYILSGNFKDGCLPNGVKYSIQEYMTKEEDKCILETHHNHIDIQFMLEGHEEFRCYNTNCLTSKGKYDYERDIEYWKDGIISSSSILVPGSVMIVYNNQPHKGAIIHGQVEKVKKLVCKIDV